VPKSVAADFAPVVADFEPVVVDFEPVVAGFVPVVVDFAPIVADVEPVVAGSAHVAGQHSDAYLVVTEPVVQLSAAQRSVVAAVAEVKRE
jgi:hypothetical protein